MKSTPKIIGLLSCGFLLCLGLSNPAQAADPAEKEKKAAPHTRQPGEQRVGGQSGNPDEAQDLGTETSRPHTRQPGEQRAGGQSGNPDEVPAAEELEKAHPSHQRQKGGPRVGGQGGQP